MEPTACQAAQVTATAPAPKPRHRWLTSPEEFIQAIYAPHVEDGAWIKECQEIQDAYAAAAKVVEASQLPKHLWAEHSAWGPPYELVRKLMTARDRAQMSLWDRACDDALAFCMDSTFVTMFLFASPFLFCAVTLPRWWSAAMSAMSAAAPDPLPVPCAAEPLANPKPGTTIGSDGASTSPTKSTASCTAGSDDGTQTSSDCTSSYDGGGTAAPPLLQGDGSAGGGHVGTGDHGLRWRVNAGQHTVL